MFTVPHKFFPFPNFIVLSNHSVLNYKVNSVLQTYLNIPPTASSSSTLVAFQGPYFGLCLPGPLEWIPIHSWGTVGASFGEIPWFSFIQNESSCCIWRWHSLCKRHGMRTGDSEIHVNSIILTWTRILMEMHLMRHMSWLLQQEAHCVPRKVIQGENMDVETLNQTFENSLGVYNSWIFTLSSQVNPSV